MHLPRPHQAASGFGGRKRHSRLNSWRKWNWPGSTGGAGGEAAAWRVACGCDDGSVLLLAQPSAHGAWEVVAEARPPPRGAGEEECAVVGLACLQVSPNTSALYVASASGGVFCWSPDEVTA